ncbi:MAG TPA: GxxExxY protein [Candidatus Thermoplasmatota archaeon]|nr:GxxExxY protein [Candidatus Thermoplasmatota archaeon]
MMGPGFLEAVYHEALCEEFEQRGIPFAHEVPLPIRYKEKRLSTIYRADFVCYGRFIVELKAAVSLGRPEEARVVNYLHATGLQVGLLLNIATPTLQIRRLSTSKSIRDFPGFPGFSETAVAADGTSPKMVSSSST